MKEKIAKLKETLWELHDENMKEYLGKKQDSDYFLHLGKTSAFGEVIDLLDEIEP